MKKFVAIFMAVLMVITLVGCGEKQEKTNDISTANPVEEVENVDSDIKTLLDDFEVYLDEYCTFIEEYSKAEPEEQMSMLGEYTKVMTEYMDIADKVQAIDTDELSTDDAAYYLEVMGRCGARMMKVQDNMKEAN